MGSTPIPGTNSEIARAPGIVGEHVKFVMTQNFTKRLSVWALVVALLLMVPLVAMQFSKDVVWTPFDFVFAGVLLFGAGLTYELIARRTSKVAYRTAVGVVVASALILVWIEGAVGIFGD